MVSDLGSVEVGPLIVTTTADSTDSSAVCGGSDVCSLRDAIGLANSYGSGDISFASSITSTPSTITLTSALPAITGNVTITGPGANLLTVSGGNSSLVGSVFVVNSGVTASLSGLTIANGNSPGGGIFNNGTLTVSNSAFSGNSANGTGGRSGGGGRGGGIFNYGTLTVSNSTFSGNSASGGGGGGIYNYGTLTVSNSTFSGNTAGDGGGIDNGGTAVTLTNSIVAGNTESASGQTGNDCGNCGTQSAYNLISTSAAPITAAQLMLGPLAYNGANQTLQTLLPLPGSPAIEAGLASTLKTDERGLPRPIGSKAVSDLGAVETNYTAVQFVQPPTNTLINATITPAVTLSVMESGAAAANIPVPLTLTGNGTLAGTTTETTLVATPGTAAVASYGNLSVNTAGTGDTLDVSLPITATGITPALTLTATSGSFDITLQTTTITWKTTPPTSVTYGAAPITLTATASDGSAVSYQVISGPATITGGNKLSFTGVGAVVVEAYTAASGNNGSGSQTANITVNPAALSVTANNASRVYGAANPTFTGTVTGAVNGDTFTESFSTTATASSAVGSYPITPTAAGTHLSDYTVTTVNGALTVTAAASRTTLTSSTSSAIAGQPVTLTAAVTSATTGSPTPTGTVTFYDGATSIGTGTLNASGVATLTTTTLPVGIDVITASYGATADYAASTSSTATVTVASAAPVVAGTTTAITATPASIAAGGSVTLTATVKSSSGMPTGAVTFTSGGASLGTANLSGGVATLTTTTLPVGTDTVTASYGGAATFAASSGSTSVTVAPATPASYTLLATPTSLSIAQGQAGSTTLTLNPVGGYSGTVVFSCLNQPAHATCVFAQNPVKLTGNNQPVHVGLTIDTNVRQARIEAVPKPTQSPLNPILPALAFWWPGSLAGLLAFGGKRSKTQRRWLQLCLLLVVTGAFAVGLSGCGGGSFATVTPVGSSTVTVVATATSATSVTRQTVALTVTIAQ